MNMINSRSSKVPNTRWGLVLVYVAFAIVALLVYHWVAEGEFSGVFTLSAIFQCLAFALLWVHALTTGSAHAISAKSLQLEAIALVCRLSSTLFFEGYLPADASGDYLYQCFDVLSLVMVIGLLYRMLNVRGATYETRDDSLPTIPFVVCSLGLACLLHGNLDDNRLFDMLWMCGLFLGAVAVVPQLWLMTRRSGSTPALASHFVAVMAFSRVLSGLYMWESTVEMTCDLWFGTLKYCGQAVLAAHLVHLVLLADFAYFYVKNLASAGLQSPLMIPIGGWNV